MKIDFINTIISCCLTALLTYICYSICKYTEFQTLLIIGSSIIFILLSIPSIAIKIPNYSRTSILLKITSVIFWSIAIITNIIFALSNFSNSSYIITNGIILILFILTYSSIYRTKQ